MEFVMRMYFYLDYENDQYIVKEAIIGENTINDRIRSSIYNVYPCVELAEEAAIWKMKEACTRRYAY